MHNGQGRDSYISSTHGGFMSPTMINAGKGTFFNQLRAYERTETNRSMSKSPSLKSFSPDQSPSRGIEDQYIDSKRDHFQRGQNLITDKRTIATILKTRNE